MALILCKECNNKVSDQAETCPHCGIKLKSNLKTTTHKIRIRIWGFFDQGEKINKKLKPYTDEGREIISMERDRLHGAPWSPVFRVYMKKQEYNIN